MLPCKTPQVTVVVATAVDAVRVPLQAGVKSKLIPQGDLGQPDDVADGFAAFPLHVGDLGIVGKGPGLGVCGGQQEREKHQDFFHFPTVPAPSVRVAGVFPEGIDGGKENLSCKGFFCALQWMTLRDGECKEWGVPQRHPGASMEANNLPAKQAARTAHPEYQKKASDDQKCNNPCPSRCVGNLHKGNISQTWSHFPPADSCPSLLCPKF